MLGIVSPLLAQIPGVSHRFFGRVGGTSPHPWSSLNTSVDVDDSPARVHENIARIRFQIGVGKDALFTAKQVHGSHVLTINDDCSVVLAPLGDALCSNPSNNEFVSAQLSGYQYDASTFMAEVPSTVAGHT